jgi:thiamine pyrophosphate-dependent acetolactate synthase large subunit-like protein
MNTELLNENKYGGFFIAQILKENEIEHVFTLTGGHIAPILIGCKKLGIQVIDVRQEVTTVFAADAYSRLSNKVGVAIVTAGPGITNTVTAVKNAQMAQSPVLVIGGATPMIFKGKGSLQDIDQISVMRSLVKWHTTIKSYRDIWKVSEALYKAKEGVPGPVFIEVAIDLLWPVNMVQEMFSSGSKKLGRSLSGKLIRWYVDRYTRKTLAGSNSFVVPKPKKQIQKPFRPNQILKIIESINSSKKPILLVGSQAIDFETVNQLATSIEKLKIPVYLSGMARGLLAKDNRLQFRHKRKNALKEADLVILAGVPNDFRLDYGRSINRRAKVISINLSKEDLNNNRKPDIGVINNPGRFLIELATQFNSEKNYWNDWFQILQEREMNRNLEILEQSKEKMVRINPLQFSRILEENLNDNSILIGDGGDIIATISYIVQPRKPLSWLDPGPFGTLGVGAGFALAAKILYPEKEIFLIYGDGSVGYSLIEWDTFIRHNIPIIGIIGNDSGWMQVAREQIDVFNDSVGTELGDRNYEKVVEGFGVTGLLVNNSDDLTDAIRKSIILSQSNKCSLLNVMIGRGDFRKGSISI